MKRDTVFFQIEYIFLCFILILNMFGCGSSRYITSKKQPEICLSEFDVKYNIVKSNFEFNKYLFGNNIYADSFFPHCFEKIGTDEYKSCSLNSEFLMDKAVELYPDIFSRAPSALPIEVSGFIEIGESKLPLLLVVGTVCIVGGVFPVPLKIYLNINTEFRISDSIVHQSDGFEVAGHAWMTVFTPLGLISVPGQTDLPKTHSFFEVNDIVGALEMNELTQKSIIYSIVENIKVERDNYGSTQ